MNSISENFLKFIESIKMIYIEEAKANFHLEYFNMDDKFGLKPIHWACLTCNIEILEWMLKEKCDIETSSRNGWRPIHFASFCGYEKMVTFLIKSCCKLDSKTDNGETVFDVANGYCKHEFIDEILNENINLKIGLSMGLKCGVDCNHKLCLRCLIRPESYTDWISWKKQSKNILPIKDSNSDREFYIRISEILDYDDYENRKCIGPNINNILLHLIHSKIRIRYGLIRSERKMIFFGELMNNGTLRNKITQIGPLNNARIYRYCKDILQAIAFLHDNKILHRFMHPANNIFIDNNGGIKLGLSDYSYSLVDGDILIDKEWLRKYKKFAFAAPELVENGILSYPYDIWLLGCNVIEMSTGNRIHFQSVTFEEMANIIPKIPNKMLQSIIKNMIMENPTDRSTANELLNHDFMRNNNYQSIFNNFLIDRKNSIDVIQNEINNTTSKLEQITQNFRSKLI